jgi:hypothetical protein
MHCDNCDKELTSIYTEYHRRKDDNWLFDDALILTLSGGYSMWLDGKVKVIVCGSCADQIYAILPEQLKTIIDRKMNLL